MLCLIWSWIFGSLAALYARYLTSRIGRKAAAARCARPIAVRATRFVSPGGTSFRCHPPLTDAHTNMSASDDYATPAPDADDEAQPGPAGTAAAGSSGDPTMAQEEEGGQPKEEEEPTDILDRLRREDRVSLTPEQPMLGRRRRSSATPAAAAAAAAARR